MEENKRVLAALRRLEGALKSLDGNPAIAAIVISHWRQIPTECEAAYEVLNRGAHVAENVATKYSLLSKIDAKEGSKLAKDILGACELCSSGVLVLHRQASGCCLPARKHAKKAALGILNSCILMIDGLIQNGLDASALPTSTGVVWRACKSAYSKTPKGNRNAMRRDFFSSVAECNETLEEFQSMMDKGPLLADSEGRDSSRQVEFEWDDFATGNSDQFSESEIPVVEAMLKIITCSRGSINVTLKASDTIGSKAEASRDETRRKELFLVIQSMYDKSIEITDGMTELGTCLYPPLEIHGGDSVLERNMQLQVGRIDSMLQMVLSNDACSDNSALLEFASKLQIAVRRRRAEAEDILRAATIA